MQFPTDRPRAVPDGAPQLVLLLLVVMLLAGLVAVAPWQPDLPAPVGLVADDD